MRLRQRSGRLAIRPAHRACGRWAAGAAPVLLRRCEDGRARWSGVATCGYVWECACCRAAQLREPAQLLSAAVQAAELEGERGYLVTLTVRRPEWREDGATRGPSCAEHVRVWLEAWRALRGRRVGRAELYRAGPWARALEITAGPSEDFRDCLWHAHGHVLVLRAPLGPAELEAWRARLAYEWREAVRSVAPDERWLPLLSSVGLDIRECSASDYLAKLGLEMTGRGKEGRQGSRLSQWQLLALTETRAQGNTWESARWAESAWREYVAATRHGSGRSLSSLQTSPAMRERMAAHELEEHELGDVALIVPPAQFRVLARRVAWLEIAMDACERGEDAIGALELARVPGEVTGALRAAQAARDHARASMDAPTSALELSPLALALLG